MSKFIRIVLLTLLVLACGLVTACMLKDKLMSTDAGKVVASMSRGNITLTFEDFISVERGEGDIEVWNNDGKVGTLEDFRASDDWNSLLFTSSVNLTPGNYILKVPDGAVLGKNEPNGGLVSLKAFEVDLTVGVQTEADLADVTEEAVMPVVPYDSLGISAPPVLSSFAVADTSTNKTSFSALALMSVNNLVDPYAPSDYSDVMDYASYDEALSYFDEADEFDEYVVYDDYTPYDTPDLDEEFMLAVCDESMYDNPVTDVYSSADPDYLAFEKALNGETESYGEDYVIAGSGVDLATLSLSRDDDESYLAFAALLDGEQYSRIRESVDLIEDSFAEKPLYADVNINNDAVLDTIVFYPNLDVVQIMDENVVILDEVVVHERYAGDDADGLFSAFVEEKGSDDINSLSIIENDDDFLIEGSTGNSMLFAQVTSEAIELPEVTIEIPEPDPNISESIDEIKPEFDLTVKIEKSEWSTLGSLTGEHVGRVSCNVPNFDHYRIMMIPLDDSSGSIRLDNLTDIEGYITCTTPTSLKYNLNEGGRYMLSVEVFDETSEEAEPVISKTVPFTASAYSDLSGEGLVMGR